MRRPDERGQALVEFSLAIIVFLMLLMGVFDLGMGIYKFNGVSQAAREIARAASVHPCTNPDACTLGDSAEVAAVVATQKALVPGLAPSVERLPLRPSRRLAGARFRWRLLTRLRSASDRFRSVLARYAIAWPGRADRPSVIKLDQDPMRTTPMRPVARGAQRGQLLVLFALASVALIAMLGLVLDGGATYAQRRTQQNGADLAALAGANAWLLDTGDSVSKAAAADVAARAVATQNGYTAGTDGTVVNVTPVIYGAGQAVTVDIAARHHNAFGSIVGLSSWEVAVTATAVVGPAGRPRGVAPFIFHNQVFVQGTGEIQPQYGDPLHPFTFGETNGDVPAGPNDLAWTVMAHPAEPQHRRRPRHHPGRGSAES